jgi:ribosomal protein L11 methyltransferase
VLDNTTVARLSTDPAAAHGIAVAVAEWLAAEDVAASIYEEAEGRWTLALHFRSSPDEKALREVIAAAAGAEAAAALVLDTLAPADWVRRGLEGLAPVHAGRFVVHGAHDRARVPANRIAVEIEAALAFGTGHHGSTRGCLIALDRILKERTAGRHAAAREIRRAAAGEVRARRARSARILDLGTGTGVLAIAAAKALRRPVLASDIDRRAVATARENARINRAAVHIEVIHAGGLSAQRFRQSGRYRLILANILLEPLQRLATPIARLLSPGGLVVLSGLLAAQSGAALASYCARGLAVVRRVRLEGWVTLVLMRPRRPAERRSRNRSAVRRRR